MLSEAGAARQASFNLYRFTAAHFLPPAPTKYLIQFQQPYTTPARTSSRGEEAATADAAFPSSDPLRLTTAAANTANSKQF